MSSSDHDLLARVEEAEHTLSALRARLSEGGAAASSLETEGALGDLQETLEKLRLRYGLLRDVLQRTSEALFAKDVAGRYLMMNPTGAAMLGRSVAQILGSDDTALFAPEIAAHVMAVDREVMKSGEPQSFEVAPEVGGAAIALRVTETAWYEPGGALRGLIGSAQDVTRQRREESGAAIRQKRMRGLASEIMLAEERLRHKLAAEIHDGLGQELVLAKMKLSALRAAASDDLRAQLSGLELLVDQADRSLRSITFRLSPLSLHDLGLIPALQWLGEDMGEQYGVRVRVVDEGTPAVEDPRLRTILFRAVRELLTNAALHARVIDVSVFVAYGDQSLRVAVSDRGVGFDSSDVDLRGHGLFGIREHLLAVGGSVHIESEPGLGTTVTLSVPLEGAHDDLGRALLTNQG